MTKFFHNAMINFRSQLNQYLVFSLVLALFSIFTSCEKEPDELGMGVLPGEDSILVKTDTAYSLLSNTVKLDSIVTYTPDSLFKIFTFKNIVGNYTDFFGKTTSSALFNFYPDSLTFNYGANPVFDSLVFILKVDSLFGNKTSDLEFRLWELNKPLSYKGIYYSNIRDAEYKGALLSTKVVKYNDSIRVKIDNSEFFSRFTQIPAGTAKNTENLVKFQNDFKGFYLEVISPTAPGSFLFIDPYIHSIDASKHDTKLSLYYKNDTKDSLRFNYFIDTRVAKYAHDYTGTAIETALQNTEISQKVTYVQGFGGLGTRIRIPELGKWADQAPVSINKAELIIPVAVNSEIPESTYPKRLAIMAVNNEGKFSSIEYGFGQTFLGGVYDATKKAYVFNLAKHIQKIANSKLPGNTSVENTDFMVIADGYKAGQHNTFNKVALDFSPGKGAKLNVIYSKQ